jgi:Fe-S-cluster containining protein
LRHYSAGILEPMELLGAELGEPRLKYPQEQNHPWISILLDIYHLVDSWVRVETKLRGLNIACKKGCGYCCKLLTVPINHLEFRGLCWYVFEILQGDERYQVKSRFLDHNEDAECPFLINDSCIVYPLRPIGCRQFFVLSRPCFARENPWLKRREDIYCALNDELSWMIAQKYFPFYGLINEKDQRKAYEEGFLIKDDRPLASYSWVTIGKKII